MTKQEIIDIVNGSELETTEKETLLAIVANEGEVISEETRGQIIDAVQNIVANIASMAGVTLDENNEVEEIDATFQKELDDAEKLLSTLDMTERDLDIAYNTVKA